MSGAAAASGSAAPPRPRNRRRRAGEGGGGEARFGVLLMLPALLAYGAVILFPFLRSLWMSTQRSTLLSPEPRFIGLGNFRSLFEDEAAGEIWRNTLVFVGAATALTFALGLAWALVLNHPFRGRAAVRAASMLPWVLPSTVTAFLWAWIFNAQYGVLNAGLLSAGALDAPVAWLADPAGAMAAVVAAKTWLSVPLFAAFFLAGLQSLPGELVEAARIDGAGNRRVLRHVVLPHLRPTMAIVLVLGAMGNLQQFDVIYAMTGGGPVRATTVLSVEVQRQAFGNWNTGLAAAVGVVWFATIAVPSVIYLRSILRDAR
ncbi:sugar ABC transporter permease [Roseomonas sp. OT10]|uniref:carbohydrate ABC transporter permease n=1 Tax=Roseomonas cutis TaxID=2897332 RepID=UPI001E33D096|nr:sugar ABC transporter permease [Roseomonas sp. OT10]UFN48003.1 sugar ABC transporter permease [Roseomonas sp. OT10]